jgi:hypothetical protein
MANDLSFTVSGPFEVELQRGNGSKSISKEQISSFWLSKALLAKCTGVYIFAFRASKGMRPFYVGKATKSFFQEVYTPHKLVKIYEALSARKKGTLVVYFVASPVRQGKVNRLAIDEAESYFIQMGMVAAPDLRNEKKTTTPRWSVKGIVRSGRGKRTDSETSLRNCLNL